MRELRNHHTLTIAMNEGLPKNKRGRLTYRHKKCVVNCPNHICTNQLGNYSFMCFGEICSHNHSIIYFKQYEGDKEWTLGFSFPHARRMVNHLKSIL